MAESSDSVMTHKEASSNWSSVVKLLHVELDKTYRYKEDLKEKLEIVKKIAKMSSKGSLKFESGITVGLIRKYTGLSTQRIKFDYDNTKCTFRNCYKIFDMIKNQSSKTSYEVLRELTLHKLRNDDISVPTILSLINDVTQYQKLQTNRPSIPKVKDFALDLAINGFIWEPYPSTRKYYITENPKNVMERIFFFEKIGYYRNFKRSIIYVETKVANLLMALPPLIWSMDCDKIKADNKNIEEAIVRQLIPNLPVNSVVVIDNYLRRSISKLPNEYASKQDMAAWLEENGIPCNRDAHKAELYRLVLKYKNVCREKYYLEEVLAGHGHTVLWRPKMSKIYSFTGILEILYSKFGSSNLKQDFINKLSQIRLEKWHQYDNCIANREKEGLSEDKMMTNLIDTLSFSAVNDCHLISRNHLRTRKWYEYDLEYIRSVIIMV